MKRPSLLTTGVAGSVVIALCCFTRVLVILFAAVGISAWLGYVDDVLFPALAIFIGLVFYALYRRDKSGSSECCGKNP